MSDNTREKLALISLQGLGNSIINLPVYLALRDAYDLELLCWDNGSAALYRSMGANVIAIRGLSSLPGVAFSVHADRAVALYPNWRRELVALACVRARHKYAPFDSSYVMSRFFPGRRVPVQADIHDIENNSCLSDELQPPGTTPACPAAGSLYAQSFGRVPPRLGWVSLHPTASIPAKSYSIEFWRDLVLGLGISRKIHLYCGRAEWEVRQCQAIIAAVSETGPVSHIFLHVNDRVDRLAEAIAGSDLFIGHDSALMHLAALFDVRLVALWSYADYRRIYPYGSRASVYMAREIRQSGSVPWRERARASDVLAIVEGKPADFRIVPKYKAPVGVHLF
jgi:ADP-heptose:LPS heptosyltransferase